MRDLAGDHMSSLVLILQSEKAVHIASLYLSARLK